LHHFIFGEDKGQKCASKKRRLQFGFPFSNTIPFIYFRQQGANKIVSASVNSEDIGVCLTGQIGALAGPHLS
jgi:hypothetical protein